MGERFGYYIMNAVLVLFLCSKFGLNDSTSAAIYSCFYCGIYILSLVGGIIADITQNYKGTIQSGLITMAAGYILLAIPITATDMNQGWLLPLTCFALLMIAFGNGLFKGNLQAIVGQMYDNFEAEAAKKGEEALKLAKDKRDSGFQIFYVFINVGGLIAPFVAPLIRSWWLKVHGFIYNAKLPALCHEQLNGTLEGDKLANYTKLIAEQGADFDPSLYLEVFNQGVHFSFIASVAAMLISLTIFLLTKKGLPSPAKKAAVESGYFTTFRYDPRLVAQGKPGLTIDCKEPDFTKFRDFVMGETRFSALPRINPAHAEELLTRSEELAKARWERIKKFGL
jgi:POT family proton-dependent oligopeptide transporter